MPDDPQKTPLETLLELGLYAPLGLALAARDSLPDLIARGRQQVTSQVALAKMMGQYAVKEGEKDLRKRVEDVSQTLSSLGILPAPNPTPGSAAPAPGTVPTPPPETTGVATDGPSSTNGSAPSTNGKASPAGSGSSGPGATTATTSATTGAATSAAAADGTPEAKAKAHAKAQEQPDTPVVRSRADLAIPGYDTLSASQVVQRLAGLSPDELEAVRDYESGTRGRRTILSKIGQLQTGSST